MLFACGTPAQLPTQLAFPDRDVTDEILFLELPGIQLKKPSTQVNLILSKRPER